MTYDFSTWYLTVVPVLIAIGISIFGNMQLSATMKALEGRIRWHHDLAAVRSAINTNKRLAWLYLCVWLGLVGALIIATKSGLMRFPAVPGHVFAFGILTAPASLWTKSVESKFKSMPIESDDPIVAETFRRYLAAWSKFSLEIPE